MFGISPDWLLHDGRPVADATVLSHPEQLARLRAACPPAADTAHLAGDPCYDRLLAALPRRDRFRRALGVAPGQRLVLLTSTWNPGSLAGDAHADVLPGLLSRLVAELPVDTHRCAAVLHPNVWHAHGPGQVRAWFDRARQAGLALVPPLGGWRQALLAADCVLGDHGSVTCYAAALGIPVLLGAFPRQDLDAHSPVAALGRAAPALDPTAALLPQLDRVLATHQPGRYRELAGQLTSAPGASAQLLRRLFYALAGLPEPADRPALLDPLPLPAPEPPRRTAPLWVHTRLAEDAGGGPVIEVTRWAAAPPHGFPDDGAPPDGGPADAAHTAVHEDCADGSRLSLADVVLGGPAEGPAGDPRTGPAAWAAETAAAHPYAAVTALVTGPDHCTARLPDGRLVRLVATPDAEGRPDLCDPAVYASALYAWLSAGRALDRLVGTGMTVRTGGTGHRVTVAPVTPGPPVRE